ncbi:MAG: adenylyltransferase/cytidyltransferase family protein [Lachnospiraceae bacterium]|jgi:choline-phosphate cytidylyltransferase|nr:adenylyltransferase/cytidyltransferase family protein [Lachnospiraceae bacterium]MCH4028446.1 adenylyltransferase/cytidyltransferase family protein [Lachnospiraceae bacterium]MCH4066295.1 adenylyltransferase/cytidyltransferase family protein [Lachnospiraceae bacterium]MCH4112326.1 adenylyltransferase/cytidyltransferase family protein [Lachnospiraceae bacterium]MCI1353305.1 adenylyltransferase/cytidyltransferase family protein [Lachnospiraceae bacterium]
MVKVITYGTFDLLHYGHIRLLQRAKALGDYLIVGVTSDAFDKARGKINVQQSLMERIDAVRATGLADQIVVEEYEGQKIDDIKKYGADIFTVGSDWKGHFDYLRQYCKVVYLDRTDGVSSSEIRSGQRLLHVGLVGETSLAAKYARECQYVNGCQIEAICSGAIDRQPEELGRIPLITDDFDVVLNHVDALILASHPERHYTEIRKALSAGKHVLCESPVALRKDQCEELFELAEGQNLILFDSIKTAYTTAFERLLLLAGSGRIGQIASVNVTCTSLSESMLSKDRLYYQPTGSMQAWGPTSLLPVFQLLGTHYQSVHFASLFLEQSPGFDAFTQMSFVYPGAVANILIGKRIKAEGELIISGSEGYIYVPAPWWKTDYFEIRYENASNNRRYFYQLEGEGFRNEIASFVRSVNTHTYMGSIRKEISVCISDILEKYGAGENVTLLKRA